MQKKIELRGVGGETVLKRCLAQTLFLPTAMMDWFCVVVGLYRSNGK